MIETLIYRSKPLGDILIADSFMKRFVGYMFQKIPEYEIIMIKPCNSIHTFFMQFNIDVLFIDKNMEVIRKVEDLGPRRIIMPVKEAAAVIEAKTGKFKNIKVGEKVSLIKTNMLF